MIEEHGVLFEDYNINLIVKFSRSVFLFRYWISIALLVLFAENVRLQCISFLIVNALFFGLNIFYRPYKSSTMFGTQIFNDFGIILINLAIIRLVNFANSSSVYNFYSKICFSLALALTIISVAIPIVISLVRLFEKKVDIKQTIEKSPDSPDKLAPAIATNEKNSVITEAGLNPLPTPTGEKTTTQMQSPKPQQLKKAT